MVLTPNAERNLLKRMRFMSFLILACSLGFFIYCFLPINPPSPLSLAFTETLEIETAGLDLPSLENEGHVDTSTKKIFLLGGFAFCAVGVGTLLFTSRKLKNHSGS